jgi:hypothetical protein
MDSTIPDAVSIPSDDDADLVGGAAGVGQLVLADSDGERAKSPSKRAKMELDAEAPPLANVEGLADVSPDAALEQLLAQGRPVRDDSTPAWALNLQNVISNQVALIGTGLNNVRDKVNQLSLERERDRAEHRKELCALSSRLDDLAKQVAEKPAGATRMNAVPPPEDPWRAYRTSQSPFRLSGAQFRG